MLIFILQNTECSLFLKYATSAGSVFMIGSWVVNILSLVLKKTCTVCMYVCMKIEAHWHKRCCHGKAISSTYSKCLYVALVTQHARHMHHIILSSVACLAIPCLCTLCHKWHDLWKKVIVQKVCGLIFSTTFVWNISHVKHPLYLIKLVLSWQVFEKYSNIKYYENPSIGSRVLCGWIDRHDEANSHISQFCEHT
jgi:hypothetical protein